MTHPDIEGVVVDELRTKFGARAKIGFGPRLDSISVEATPQVIEEVRAAVKVMEPKTTFDPLAVLMGGGGVQDGSVQAPRVASVRPTDPQEAALGRAARELAMKFRMAKLDEQTALRRELEQLTERHFDQRQQRRQAEIDELAHRMDVLRVTHHRRQQNKAAVIQQRIQDLLAPNADLRWDEAKNNSSSLPDSFRRVDSAHQSDPSSNLFESAEKIVTATEKMVGTAHPTGLARPTVFTVDREKLSEGHVLLEFERDR